MDTPRRWQVASVATAVASLGIGGAFLARPDTASVPSIELDDVDTVERGDGPVPAADLAEDPAGPSIVLPRSIASPTATTATSTDSPDEDGSEPVAESPAPTSVDEPAPTTSNAGDSPDDAGDSPADPGNSADDDGSVDSAD